MTKEPNKVISSLMFVVGLVLMFFKRDKIAEVINTPAINNKESNVDNGKTQVKDAPFWSTVKHFKPSEFDSRAKKDTGFLMDKEYIRFLDAVREAYGSPMSVSNGYRTKEHNASIVNSKGQQYSATNSPHLYGIASDISTHNYTETKKLLSTMLLVRNSKFPNMNLGLGVYGSGSRPNGFFIHSDTRGHRMPPLQKDTFWTGNSYPKGGYRKLTSSELKTFTNIFNNGKK